MIFCRMTSFAIQPRNYSFDSYLGCKIQSSFSVLGSLLLEVAIKRWLMSCACQHYTADGFLVEYLLDGYGMTSCVDLFVTQNASKINIFPWQSNSLQTDCRVFRFFLYAPLIAEWFAEKCYAIIIRNTKFWALWMNISCETGKFWQFTFLPIQFRTIIVWRTLSSQAFRCQRADTAASLLKQLSRWETDCLSTRCVCVCADYYLCIMRHATTYMADVCVFAIPEMPITRCAVAHNQ